MVYAAYDDRLDRKVAIKVLRPQNKSVDATGRARLLREAQAMARLSHPNIVTVHESGEHEGEVFLAMEFVRGRGLDRWLREQKHTWREVLDVFVEAGRGLQAAHLAGLIHRDFKPQNVLISDDGCVKVMDFGLARTSGEQQALEPAELSESSESATPAVDGASHRLLDLSLTSTGAVMGTPAYMAPEQHLGTPVTPRTDQFNFCVALYEGLYGQLPFPTDNLAKLVDSVISGSVTPPPAGSGVPQWVQNLVRKGLAVDPDARHESMEELLRALTRDPAKRRRRVLSLGALVGVVAIA
ncbi:MAG: serine/threonine-protein kinase, partial [Nannocystaceae bacterium]